MRVGVLHPGEMGISIARALLDAGHDTCWVVAGRSEETVRRAAELNAYADLCTLLGEVEAVISVCPPHAALASAQAVKEVGLEVGFDGLYVDANAVAPATAGAISTLIGAGYVDGGIIGPPACKPGTTRLYLSGEHAPEVAGWFSGGALQAIAMEGDITAASALKMAYAAYTKGTSALLLAVNALAVKAGVQETLIAEWALSQPGLASRSEKAALGTSRKAWRFSGEMHEIAGTFAEFHLPDDFHKGAAEIFRRMAPLKDLPPCELSAVLALIIDQDQ